MSERANYLIKRVLQNIVTFFVLVSLIFVLFRLLPGDPAAIMLDPLAGAAEKELVRERFGLNEPVHVQYGLYFKNLFQGDLGQSFYSKRPVLNDVIPRFLNTLVLAILCTIVSYVLGALLGAMLAWKRGTRLEKFGSSLALVLRAAPPFWVALMAIMLFSFVLDWLPFYGMHSGGFEAESIWELYFNWDFLKHAILPVMVGSIYFMGVPLLLVRGTMLEIMGEDFIELSRAKGVNESNILLRHAARNALLPVLTEGASFVGWALGGLVIIEYIFSWPGLGRMLIDSIDTQDFPIAQGALILIASMIMMLNLIMDFLYVYIDPRVDLK